MPTLTWLTRNADMRRAAAVPVRSLLAAPEHDCGEAESGNLLVQGDNLDVLKALIPHYAGAVKCIFIDPPYNTRKDFAHYQDNLEHAQWLEMMYPRLELLSALLAKDGSIWAIIDDDEGHYLKVLMDEIFGRRNFVANVVWQKKHTRANDARWFSDNHDHILVYAKNKSKWTANLLPRTEKQDKGFSNLDNDPRGDWASQPIQVKTPNEDYIYEIKNPAGKSFYPPSGRSWQFSKQRYKELVGDNRIWFGKTGEGTPRIKKFLSEVQGGLKALTIWPHTEVGHNQDAKTESKKIDSKEVFSTPKPEKLLHRILHLATRPGDLVLDSFLGSGTTAAVAHKMNRRWIGVEMGEHAKTHCVPRMRAVIGGEQGGISEAVGWKGGGGFRFLQLGGAVFGEEGDINAEIDFPTLAAHIWFAETRTPLPPRKRNGAFLGAHNGAGYALLFNGILKDTSIAGGNVLTAKTLAAIRKNAGRANPEALVVYGEGCNFGDAHLKREGIEFKQIPYDCEKR